MPKLLKISVTQAHIDRGEKKTRTHCPVALACADAGLLQVSVGWTFIIYWKWKEMKVIKNLSYSVVSFIKRFDRGYKVTPTEFELELPE